MTEDRWRHHRLRDHFGVESDLYVVLSEAIGPYPAGTPIHYVIEALLAGQTALASGTHRVTAFSANAVIHGGGGSIVVGGTTTSAFSVNAALKRVISPTFVLAAWLVGGKTFTMNAVIRGAGSFSVNAVLA